MTRGGWNSFNQGVNTGIGLADVARRANNRKQIEDVYAEHPIENETYTPEQIKTINERAASGAENPYEGMQTVKKYSYGGKTYDEKPSDQRIAGLRMARAADLTMSDSPERGMAMQRQSIALLNDANQTEQQQRFKRNVDIGLANAPDAKGEDRALLAASLAAEQHLKNGNIDAYFELTKKSADLQSRVMGREMNSAGLLLQSGDAKGALEKAMSAHGKYVVDGYRGSTVTENQDGSFNVLDKNGKPLLINISQDPNSKNNVGAVIQWFSNPSNVMAMQQKAAEKRMEADIEVDASNRKETHKAGLKPPEVVKASGGEGKPDRVGIQGRDGMVVWQDGGAQEAGPLDSKTATKLSAEVASLYKVSDMESMSPDIRKKVSNAKSYGIMLMQSNVGTEAGNRLDHVTAAGIAAKIADGEVPEQKFADKSGNIWRGVTVNGVKYLLDPQPIGRTNQAPAGAPVDATTSASPREVSGKIRNQTGGQEWAGINGQAQAEQPARDAAAAQLKAQEARTVEDARVTPVDIENAKRNLAAVEKELYTAKDAKRRQILEGERARIIAGLSSLQGGSVPKRQAPSSALAYLQAHPEAAPQFKQKFGYLPEGF